MKPGLGQAIAQDPARAYFTNLEWLGWANFYLRRYDPAIAYFEQAQRLDPQSAGPYQGLGDVYYQRKECDKALEEYREYLKRVEGEAEKYVVARVEELGK